MFEILLFIERIYDKIFGKPKTILMLRDKHTYTTRQKVINRLRKKEQEKDEKEWRDKHKGEIAKGKSWRIKNGEILDYKEEDIKILSYEEIIELRKKSKILK